MKALESLSASTDRYGCKEKLHFHARLIEFATGHWRSVDAHSAENAECLADR